jgi:hypothetical protein
VDDRDVLDVVLVQIALDPLRGRPELRRRGVPAAREVGRPERVRGPADDVDERILLDPDLDPVGLALPDRGVEAEVLDDVPGIGVRAVAAAEVPGAIGEVLAISPAATNR